MENNLDLNSIINSIFAFKYGIENIKKKK